MKIPPFKIDQYISNLPNDLRAALVYGPDEGLIRERAKNIGLKIVNDINDPFLVSELSGAMLKAEPAILFDEAMAISMIGGRRIVKIENCSDSDSKLFAEFLEKPLGDAFILLMAGNLTAKSKLRALFEKSKNAASIACYPDNIQNLNQIITNKMQAANITIDRDCMGYLASQLGNDRAISNQEIDKLIIYLGDRNIVTIDDIKASIGDNSLSSFDNIIYAAASGNAKKLDLALESAWSDNISPVPILRMMANHLIKLQLVNAKSNAGGDVKSAMRYLYPPIFYQLEKQFISQLRPWSNPIIAMALPILLKAEADCKKTNQPAILIASRSLQHMAAIARKYR